MVELDSDGLKTNMCKIDFIIDVVTLLKFGWNVQQQHMLHRYTTLCSYGMVIKC